MEILALPVYWYIGYKIGEKVGEAVFGKKDNENNNNGNLNTQINMERERVRRMEEMRRENDNRIRELERQLKENLEEQKRKKLQRELEEKEKERIQQFKELEERNKRQKSVENCKNLLSKEFCNCIMNAVCDFINERDKWLEKLLSDENLNNKLNTLKDKLSLLFNNLFESEKILDKINNKFIIILESNANMKELKKMNFMIIGTSGVGKSTLVNQLLRENLAPEGIGKRCTTIAKRYESNKFPFITLTDTVGTEIGNEHNLKDVERETLNEITEKLNNNDPNEHIHGIIYCTTSNRFFKDELKLLLKIREKYDGKKLPIVIVYTKATDDNEAEGIKNAINEFLNEYGEKISDDIFGIQFIKIMAREKPYVKFGKELCDYCFGLSNLISTIYKKGEKAYKIAIKNSLIQIAKNSIIEYTNNIAANIANNLNFFRFLQYNYENNFSEYIAYCFEKMTNIENLNEINFCELDDLYNYLIIKESKNKKDINEINKINENNEINKKTDLGEKFCIFCGKDSKKPYVCSNCGAFTCEDCFLQQLQYVENVICNCQCDNFILIEEEQNKNFNIINEKEKDYILEDNINIDKNILKNNLNIESKNKINEYIKEFRNEIINILGKKFDEYTMDASTKIYYQISDKYNEIIRNENMNMNNAMKSQEQLKLEATNIIKEELKESSEELFLTKNSSYFYQNIIIIFQEEMIKKIDDFIKNLNNNNKFLNFLESYNILKEENNLKIEAKFNEYIKILKKIENESQKKAFNLQYGKI